MLELDLILTRFIDKELDDLTSIELDALESLLSTPDPILYSWLMGVDIPIDKELLTIVELIKRHDNVF